jgi:alpha-tubulin suppressor-like RCC1 family protein
VRALVFVALLSACTTTNRCKPGTALVRITLPSPGPFTLLLSLAGAPDKQFDETAAHTQESIEIDFSSQYPQGQNLTVTIESSQGNASIDFPLDKGCSVIDLVVAPPDMSQLPDGVKPIGAVCSAGDVCAGAAPCVDHRCCEVACTGQCEACDVPQMEGHCVPVSGPPHGNRTACIGDTTGPCAGSCDGTTTDACIYPTAPCTVASCFSNVATSAKLCSNGSCPTGAADTQTCHLGCDATSTTCLGVKQLAAGYSFACATLTDGTVRCWGDNSQKQIGQGTSTQPSYKAPIKVMPLANVSMVACTFDSACALINDGTVQCWGGGNGTPAARNDIAGASFINGSSGGHYCAIVAGGELRCWGGNSSGQLGGGSLVVAPPSALAVCAPGEIMLPCAHMTGVTHVRGGDSHTCAVAGGNVYCWGGNGNGELGYAVDSSPHPFPSPVPLTNATRVAAGNGISCAVDSQLAKCWGSNDADRLGSNQTGTQLLTPTSVCTTTNCSSLFTNVIAISTVDESNCAVNASGEVRCWGHNGTSQLGDGSTTSTKASQGYAATITIASGAVDVIAGGGSNYAIIVDRADRYLVGWGADGAGELGDNSAISMPSPTPVMPAW